MQPLIASVVVNGHAHPIDKPTFRIHGNIPHNLLLTIGMMLIVMTQIAHAQIASDQFNRGFEDNVAGGNGFWTPIPGAVSVDFQNGSPVRTGSRSLMHRVNSTTKQRINYTGHKISVPAGNFAHFLFWTQSNNSAVKTNAGISIQTLADVESTDFSPNNSNWNNRAWVAVQNTSGTAQLASGYLQTRSTGAGNLDGYYDDFVIYTSNSSTTDLSKPSAPSCFGYNNLSNTGITLQWSNGSDGGTGATGVQGTLVLRTISTAAATPTLFDQGTYTNSTNAADGMNTIGSWTIIADIPAAQTTYTDANVVAGTLYRYTLVHYDLALNYSASATAINLKAIGPDISESVQNLSKPTGGTFTPGDTLRINVSVAVPSGNSVHNVVARINMPSGLNYVPNSMKILDNKGASYSSATAASALMPCSGSYTELGSTVSLLDGAGNDRGLVASGYAQIMLGELPSPVSYANLEANVGNQSGGRIVGGQTKPRFYSSQTIIVASIDVTISPGTAVGTVFPITSAVSYSFTERSAIAQKTTYTIEALSNPDRFIEFVVSDPTLPNSYSTRGANLFSLYNNGTFGNGTDISGPDPSSSPNFQKNVITTGTPNDGAFAVVKNTAGNQIYYNNDSVNTGNGARVFGVWSILGDHTGASSAADGNKAVHQAANGGYALAVNADYVPKRVVSQTLTGLCPGTFYNFKAWLRNVCPACGCNSDNGTSLATAYSDARRQGVKPNLTFDVNNKAYYTTGPIDTADKWIQKEFVFATGTSSGDFNFSIRNNANGGDGNDWMLDDISIITRGPSASAVVSADPFVDPNPATFCAGQRFRIIGNWIENTGSFTQYDSYQFQYAYGPTGPWNAISSVSELPAPNDPYNVTGWLDSISTQAFNVTNQDIYFRVVVATQPSNISLDDAAPCQVTAYNSSVVHIAACTLPIKLLRFNASTFGQQVMLKWAAGDLNTLQHFIVERSSNGIDFAPISKVDAKAYTTAYQYQLSDNPTTGSDQLWYRLKMVHLNNEITYSSIEMVGWKKAALSLSIQPNPAKEMVQLNWSGVSPNQKVKLTINSISGQVLHTQMMTIQQGPSQNLKLPNIPAGLYFVQVEDEKTQFRQTIKLNKL